MVYGLVFPFCAFIFKRTQMILSITFSCKLFPFPHYIIQIATYIFSVPQGYSTASFQVFGLCQTSWVQSCNQIMRVEQSVIGSHCDGMMQSICWCLLVCYRLWRHSYTALSMTNWFSWSFRIATHIHLFSDSLYYLWDSSSDDQQRNMGLYLYKHTDGDQIQLQALSR